MPPIVPPTNDSLSAPLATTPTVTTRRLAIFYQSGREAPVAPAIDREVDIAEPILDRFADYASERSQINNISLVAAPVEKIGFGNQQDTRQPKYIDISGIPNAATEFNSQPTQFPIETVTPDSVGINYKTDNAQGPRNFNLNVYKKLYINPDNAKLHGDLVDETLLSSRGHNSENKTITPDITQEKNDGKITLGSYFYKTIGNSVNYVSGSYVRSTDQTQTDVPAMTIDQMKVIGLNVMFEAVQGSAGLDYAITEESAASKAEAEARMVIPSEQRIGKRVSLGRFTPAYQIKKLTGVEKPNNLSFIETTDDVQTYGSLYNVYSQFDSLISIGQIALAVAMILAFVLLLSVIAAISNKRKDPVGETPFASLDNSEKQRLLGASVLQDSGVYPLSNVDGADITAQFLGTQGMFSYTRYQLEECLNAGIQEFFGFSFLGGSLTTGVGAGQQAAASSLKILTESGRLNVILRELLRSGITVFEDTALDFTGGASIAGIGNLIRKIRDLKIVRFINVLMGMGDKVKFEFDLRARAAANLDISNNSSLMTTGSNVSYVDSLPDLRPYFVAKSRLSSQKGLAWSNKTAGMVSLPLAGLANQLPQPGSFNAVGLGQNQNGFSTHWSDLGLQVSLPDNHEQAQLLHLNGEQRQSAWQNGRLSADVVNLVENELEADYMPFYIHDLRTNEILSFHAFLEDASEDFNVEYSSQEGYGRMDKVQIFKGTTRNISVNFKMVATSEDDHDIMWYKINRLAMMIYPQWTQGRKISVQNIKFIQPFSQIPGATPVIRLRLGDLYKSNYSKMAVARLFGVTTDVDYNVDANNIKQAQTRGTAPAGGAPASDAGNPTTETPDAKRQRAAKLRERPLAAATNDGGAASANGRRHRQRTTSRPTYAVREVLVAGDKIVFKTEHFPNARNYKLANAATGTTPEERQLSTLPSVQFARIICRVVRITDSNRNGHHVATEIIVKPERYIWDAAGAMQNNQTNNIEATPSAQIVAANGSEAPENHITIEQLQNGNILDTASTSFIWEQEARNTSIAQQAQNSTPSQQEEAIRGLSPQVFYDVNNNPIMKAFRSSGGKGLAGVITSFKIDYGEAKGNWGTNGSDLLRAPMFVTVQLQMAVIHDITPGLDANGIMWAPIWPVGKTSNHFVNNGIAGTENPTSITEQPVGSGQHTTKDIAPVDYFAVNKGKPLYYNRKG